MYHRKDAFYGRAKASGYRSRAAFKLLQLTQRGRLLRPGDRVIELGAWPGGWLQVAADLVGAAGKVVGVDLQAIAPLPSRVVVTIVGDVLDSHTRERVVAACGGTADVLLSDLAPKLTGIRAQDAARANALADCVVLFAQQVLKPGGTLILKMFMSGDLTRRGTELRALFQNVRLVRPEATRRESAEIYAVARGFHGPR